MPGSSSTDSKKTENPNSNPKPVPCYEPVAPRYIYVNPENNWVHLMVPIVGGVDIGTDNTCQAVVALREFFFGTEQKPSVLQELEKYEADLKIDLRIMGNSKGTLQKAKHGRQEQVAFYIQGVTRMLASGKLNCLKEVYPRYPKAIQEILGKRENIYSMVLRPEKLDSYLRSVNPVFAINRQIQNGFYAALKTGYADLTLDNTPRAQLINTALDEIQAPQAGAKVDLGAIQAKLAEKMKILFNREVDFTKDKKGDQIDASYFENILSFEGTEEPAEYIETLVNACTTELWETIPSSPFNMKIESEADREKLSIATQFFLGEVNIYCYANKLFKHSAGGEARNLYNFEWGLNDLSRGAPGSSGGPHGLKVQEMIKDIKKALCEGNPVEDVLLRFINENPTFLLEREMTPEEMEMIKQKFMTHYKTIQDSPHFDEFTIFDKTKAGKGLSHQGALCVDFAELLDTEQFKNLRINTIDLHTIDDTYASIIRGDAEKIGVKSEGGKTIIDRTVPHKNEWVAANFDMETADFTLPVQSLGVVPLMQAVAQGNEDLVRRYLSAKHKEGLNLAAWFRGSDKTAFVIAIEQQNPNMMRILLEAGANDDMNKPHFQCAIEHGGNLEVIDILIEKTKKEDEIIAGQVKGYLGAFQQMTSNRDAYRALPYAVSYSYGKTDIVKRLLSVGADCNACSEYGDSALMLAVKEGNPELVEILTEAMERRGKRKFLGKDSGLNYTDAAGRTALMIAVQKGNVDIVKFLVEKGAKTSLKNAEGHTALDLADEAMKQIISEAKQHKYENKKPGLLDMFRGAKSKEKASNLQTGGSSSTTSVRPGSRGSKT